MKQIILCSLLILSATSAFASENFYQCEGFSDVDEYRVGINLATNKAGFFDNDSTSYMTLKEVKSLESLPPQTQMIFEGKDNGSTGTLRLTFNLTMKKATLVTISRSGKVEDLGTVGCAPAEPWDDL